MTRSHSNRKSKKAGKGKKAASVKSKQSQLKQEKKQKTHDTPVGPWRICDPFDPRLFPVLPVLPSELFQTLVVTPSFTVSYPCKLISSKH